jgi:hypothetical protein
VISAISKIPKEDFAARVRARAVGSTMSIRRRP